jgi:hypothetical protein
MNTCLSVLYLKLHKIDSRYVRMALTVAVLFFAGGTIMGLPINGDVGI